MNIVKYWRKNERNASSSPASGGGRRCVPHLLVLRCFPSLDDFPNSAGDRGFSIMLL
jgi:hypothetical protein